MVLPKSCIYNLQKGGTNAKDASARQYKSAHATHKRTRDTSKLCSYKNDTPHHLPK